LEHHKISNSGTLTVISGHELDAHDLKVAHQEVNFLREKTFTKELSSLVDRIFTNESVRPATAEKDDLLNLTEKQSILLEYEKLIYSLKHSSDIPEISSRYNPFNLNIDVHDDIDGMENYLRAGMDQSGFNQYGIFKFNLKENAYRFAAGSLSEAMKKNCFFGVSDPVLSGTFSEYGIILKREDIEADPFLAKKFNLSSYIRPEENSFYLNRIYNYCKNLFSTSDIPELTRLEKFTSPLLLIPVPAGIAGDESDIHSIIKSNLSIPFSVYLSHNRLKPVIADFDYNESLLLIEIFQKMPYSSALKWCVIKGGKEASLENLFMLKYLLAKLRLRTGRNSLILRVASSNIVMALEESELEDIRDCVRDFKSRSGQIIDISFIDYHGHMNKNKFIELFL